MALNVPYSGGTSGTIVAPFTGVADGEVEIKSNKGAPNGYAPLDANSRVPTINLPDGAALDAEVDGKVLAHSQLTTSVHGIADTAALALKNDALAYAIALG